MDDRTAEQREPPPKMRTAEHRRYLEKAGVFEGPDAPVALGYNPTSTGDLLKSVDSLRAENRDLRQILMREADDLAGENADLRAFLGAQWC